MQPMNTLGGIFCGSNPVRYIVIDVISVRVSLEFVQMFQSRQNDLFTRLFNLASEENLVQDRVDLHTGPISASCPRLYLSKQLPQRLESAHLVEVED